MRHFLTLLITTALQLISTPMPATAAGQESIHIGSRRELFVDHYLIDRLKNVRLVLNRPRDEGIALKFDKPWEGLFCGYATIIKDGDLYRAYYRGRPDGGQDGDSFEVYCCAESSDGVHWTKPDLELFEVRGCGFSNFRTS